MKRIETKAYFTSHIFIHILTRISYTIMDVISCKREGTLKTLHLKPAIALSQNNTNKTKPMNTFLDSNSIHTHTHTHTIIFRYIVTAVRYLLKSFAHLFVCLKWRNSWKNSHFNFTFSHFLFFFCSSWTFLIGLRSTLSTIYRVSTCVRKSHSVQLWWVHKIDPNGIN